MLNAKTIEEVSKVLGISAEDFTKKVTSENEESLDVPKLFKQEEVNTMTVNIRKEGFAEGKKAATEILVKDLKVKHGIESETKNIDEFIDLFSKKISKNEDVNVIRDKYQKDMAAKDEEIKKISSEIWSMQVVGEIMNHLSGITKETVIPKQDILTLYRNSRQIEKDDAGKIVIKKDGQVMKTELQEPISLETDISSFVAGYIKKEGMGRDDEPGGGSVPKFKSIEDYTNWAVKKGIEPMAPENLKLYNENKL